MTKQGLGVVWFVSAVFLIGWMIGDKKTPEPISIGSAVMALVVLLLVTGGLIFG